MAEAKPTPRQIAEAARYGWGHLNSVRCDMGEMGNRRNSYTDDMRRQMDLALDLIEAAPELLAALQRLVADSMFKDHPEASQMAIAAIAKVKGKNNG